MLGASDEEFINYVMAQDLELYEKLYNYMIYEDAGGYIVFDEHGGFINLKHLAAAAEGYIAVSLVPAQWYGWVGDMASIVRETEIFVEEEECSFQSAADEMVGNDEYSFSYIDLCADADVIKVAELIKASTSTTHSFSEALRNYYNNYVDDRFYYFFDDIGCKANLTDIREKLVFHLDSLLAEIVWILGLQMEGATDKGFIAILSDLIKLLDTAQLSGAHYACCAALANYLYCELNQ